MPVYEYYCNKCEHTFDEVLPMSRYNEPCENPCPKCGGGGGGADDDSSSSSSSSVQRVVSITQMGVDATMTPDKKTGGQFSELMSRMKDGLPKRYRDNLDHASSRTGKRMGSN